LEHCNAARDDSVAIASLNLHCGIGTRGQPYDVEAAICGLNAPVIALQEAWRADSGPDAVAAAAKAIGAELFRVPLRSVRSMSELGIPARSGPGRTGIAVLTTLDVIDHEIVDLGQARGDMTPRCAQVLTVALPGGSRLRLACTHLTHRLRSPVQLGRLVRRLAGPPVPTVIVGDLNMPRQIATITPGYAPTVRGRTWPAELPLVQLDHVLAGRGAHPVDGAVLPPAGSDHLPIRARIRLG
jgi:endonuclease/exonuclease/phosphatase family metal-dependent hydrolase